MTTIHKLILLSLLIIHLPASAQNGADSVRALKYFESGTFFYDRIMPMNSQYNEAGIPNFNLLGLEGEFLCYTFGQWRWKQRVGITFGWRETANIIENITFEGGYQGGFSVWDDRLGLNLGTVVSFQPNPKLELAVPIQFGARLNRGVGRYFLYDGQTIDPADQVDNHEATSSNKIVFYNKWMPGLQTGLELVASPNSHLSFVSRINFHCYGSRTVTNSATAQLNPANQTVSFDSKAVGNTSEWGFSLGVRFYFIRTSATTTERKPKEKKKDDNVILTPKKRQ